jgi:predicted nucleic acid-binding protein
MSSAAVDLFLQSASEKVELHRDSTIIAETTFVLISLYQQSQPEVADAIRDLITGCRLKVPLEEVMLDALEQFKAQPVDFPDALVAAIAAHHRGPVASFDRDFDRFKDVKRFESSVS